MRNDDLPFADPRSSRGIKAALFRMLPTKPARLGACLLVVAIVGGVGWSFYSSSPVFEVRSSSEESVSAADPSIQQETQPEVEYVVVHVSGAVASPGVYSLPEGSRVNDAIDAAGGFAEDAQPDTVNLARVLSDGEQIAIQTRDEAEASAQVSGQPSASAASSGASSGLVNINTADATLLQTLSGVGPSTAQAIVSDREKNGPFASVDDLTRVDGIGDKKLAKIRDSICV